MMRILTKIVNRHGLSPMLASAALLSGLFVFSASAHAVAFSCGPHTPTYAVRALDNRMGTGVRCLKFNPQQGARPLFVWYGEGNWGAATYRNVGAGFRDSDPDGVRKPIITGYASDIPGDGATTNNTFPRNIEVRVMRGNWPAPAEIHVLGAWNEVWTLVEYTQYRPLEKPTACGDYFKEFEVSDLTHSRLGSGLRCVLRMGGGQPPYRTAWFGFGNWNNTSYAHLGIVSIDRTTSGTFAGTGGASDICGLGNYCKDFYLGSLRFNAIYETILGSQPPQKAFLGYKVTGAWSEAWEGFEP